MATTDKVKKTSIKDSLLKNIKLVLYISLGVFSTISVIGGGVLYVDRNYAHAGDVKQILENQKSQIDFSKKQQQQNLVFQLEYYDDRIKYLIAETRRARFIMTDPSIPATAKNHVRDPEDIQREIADLKLRREIIRRNLTGQ